MLKYILLSVLVVSSYGNTFIKTSKEDLNHKTKFAQYDAISRMAINKATKATKLIYFEKIKSNHELSKSAFSEMTFVTGRVIKK